MSSSQEQFDRDYVCSVELCRVLGVTRATIMDGHRRGALPEPVRILTNGGNIHVVLWPRAQVQPFVDRWLAQRAAA